MNLCSILRNLEKFDLLRQSASYSWWLWTSCPRSLQLSIKKYSSFWLNTPSKHFFRNHFFYGMNSIYHAHTLWVISEQHCTYYADLLHKFFSYMFKISWFHALKVPVFSVFFIFENLHSNRHWIKLLFQSRDTRTGVLYFHMWEFYWFTKTFESRKWKNLIFEAPCGRIWEENQPKIYQK